MYSFKLTFSGELTNNAESCKEQGDGLEKIGREVVELLRNQGYYVQTATLAGPLVVDLTSGVAKPAQSQASMPVEDDTKDIKKPGRVGK